MQHLMQSVYAASDELDAVCAASLSLVLHTHQVACVRPWIIRTFTFRGQILNGSSWCLQRFAFSRLTMTWVVHGCRSVASLEKIKKKKRPLSWKEGKWRISSRQLPLEIGDKVDLSYLNLVKDNSDVMEMVSSNRVLTCSVSGSVLEEFCCCKDNLPHPHHPDRFMIMFLFQRYQCE